MEIFLIVHTTFFSVDKFLNSVYIIPSFDQKLSVFLYEIQSSSFVWGLSYVLFVMFISLHCRARWSDETREVYVVQCNVCNTSSFVCSFLNNNL